MSDSSFELADFTTWIQWSRPFSLPVEEFSNGFEESEFERVSSDEDEMEYTFSDGSIYISYNVDDAAVSATTAEVETFEQAVDALSRFASDWSTTDPPDQYSVAGEVIVRHAPDDGKTTAADALAQFLDGPEMVPGLAVEGARPLTYRYTNAHRQNPDPTVDIKIEPYVENPEYFYIVVRKAGTERSSVWDTARGIPATIESLVELVTDND
jgi:hypothetical protein